MKQTILLLGAMMALLLAACGDKQPATSASLEAQALDKKVYDALVAGQWATITPDKASKVYRFRKGDKVETTLISSGIVPAPIDETTTLNIRVEFKATVKGSWEYANRMATITYDRHSLQLEVLNVAIADQGIDRATLALLNAMLDDDAVKATLQRETAGSMFSRIPDGEVLSNIDVTVGIMTARNLADSIITFQRR